MTFTRRPIKVSDCTMMWNNLADDVRNEFIAEGIVDLCAFRQDVFSGETTAIYFDEDGNYLCALWVADGDGERTFGACVNKPENLKSRVGFARMSADILKDFASLDNSDASELVVYIPMIAKRCIKHARRFCGLEWTKIESFGDLDCHRFVYKKGATQ